MKKSFVLVFVVFVLLGLFFVSASGTKMQDIKYTHVKVHKSDVKSSSESAIVKRDPDFGKIPLYFIPNKGQVDEKARFYAKTSRYTLWMTKEGLVFDSMKSTGAIEVNEETGNNHSKFKIQNSKLLNRDVSRLVFLGANKNPEMVPIAMTPHKVSYFKGKDPSKWQTGIQTSKAVLYKDIYKNIDLKVYGIEKQIEYDWIVKPGGNSGDIRFEYKDVKITEIDNQGNLIIETKFGKLEHKKPVGYQVINENRVDVSVEFRKLGKNMYGFSIDTYEKDNKLIIDPVISLTYSTYLGGNRAERGLGIKVDAFGHIYVTAETISSDFPSAPLCHHTNSQSYDIVVTKFSRNGAELIYSTHVGGGRMDVPLDIAVTNNYVYVTGYTYSSNIPAVNSLVGDADAFVCILDTAGSFLNFRYLGGADFDAGCGITIDNSNNAYIVGMTGSFDFPTVNPYQDANVGKYDAFVCKVRSNSDLIYSTYLGGSDYDYGRGIAVDSAGSFYVAGRTMSTDFPTHNPYQKDFGGSQDGFVCKFNSDGSDLVYSTYLGGSKKEHCWRLMVDSSGSAYVTGITSSTEFPTKNAFQDTLSGESDAFLTKLNSNGSDIVYSTYLGGSDFESDWGGGLVIDSSGNAYVSGGTKSTDFPIRNAYQPFNAGDWDAFVTHFTQDGSDCFYSTYLGGSGHDYCSGIALDSSGYASYIVGTTFSTDFPTKNPYQHSLAGDGDVFVSKLSFSGCAPVLWINKKLLNFGVNSSGDKTGPQRFLVHNFGGGTLNWTVTYNTNWIKCSPTSGTNFGVVEVSLYNLDGLVAGPNTAEIEVCDPNAPNSPQTVYITIWLYTAGSPPYSNKPFGYFETPLDNSFVNGSVPFTGWALDDIEVVSVRLYREVGPNLIYIGDALFVEGARPDIAQTYPQYPHSSRAGWGYMMLTNFLLDGTYVLHAIATDREGNKVTLGTNTITIINATAVKPFGAIATPAPGGTASGSNYRVQGWALTPPPNKIPSNGVHLYVDGVDLGEAAYDIFRQDIYDLFPGYENRDGALAYYDLNTIGYDNGMHTVHFVATDNADNTDGIGSRYFNIWNLGTLNSVSQVSSQRLYSMPEIIKIPVDYSGPVNMKKGYNANIEPETVYPDEKGNITIEIKELERIVIHLSEVQADVEVEEKGSKNSKFKIQNSKFYSGYQVTGVRLTPLPIGSTMDTEKGIFYWSPGPGFIGEYRFAFVKKGPDGAMNKKFINVKVVSKFGK